MYNPVVLPEVLRDSVLMLAHEKQGHNGARRIYNSIKRLYHWKGIKETHPDVLHTLLHMCKVQHKSPRIREKTFLKSSTTHGIYLYGLDWGIQSSIAYGQQVCIDSSIYVNWIHILYSHRYQISKRCCKCVPQPHLMYIWTI